MYSSQNALRVNERGDFDTVTSASIQQIRNSSLYIFFCLKNAADFVKGRVYVCVYATVCASL